jgi:6-phosphogluconolactonase
MSHHSTKAAAHQAAHVYPHAGGDAGSSEDRCSPLSAGSSSQLHRQSVLSHNSHNSHNNHKVDKEALRKQMHMYASKEQLAAGLRDFLRERSQRSILATGSFVVGLSGGSLVGLLSRVLVDLVQEAEPGKWFCFLVDERYVPETSSDSNAGQWLAEGLPSDCLHRRTPRDATSSPVALEAAAVAAEDTLKWVLEETSKDGPDLLLLGMGSDGHVASLFPRHLGDDQQYSRLYVAVSDAPTGPPQRLTMTLAALGAARDVVFVVHGTHKAAAVERVWLEHDRTLPAYVVGKSARNAHWFLDDQAGASLLPYFWQASAEDNDDAHAHANDNDEGAKEKRGDGKYILYQHANSSASSLSELGK